MSHRMKQLGAVRVMGWPWGMLEALGFVSWVPASFHSLGGLSILCKLQKALLSERKIWNLFSNILNLLAYLESWIAHILNQMQTFILYCFLIVFELQNSLWYALLRILHISMDMAVSNNKDQSLHLKIVLITMLFRQKYKITCINLDMLRLQCITCPWYFQKDTNKIWIGAVKPSQLYDSLGRSGCIQMRAKKGYISE